jgi:hypothetical protein
MKTFITPLLFFAMTSLQAQQPSAVGEYYMHGVMETASAFALKADSTFEFYYSYGAVDRYGKGKWYQKGDSIVLNSDEKHTSNFKLVKSEQHPGKDLTIKFSNPDRNLLSYLSCLARSSKEQDFGRTDNNGIATIPLKSADSLYVVFELCPERISSFKVTNKNYFEFELEPWVAEVTFDNFSLRLTDKGLEGHHPLLEPTKVVLYERQGN